LEATFTVATTVGAQLNLSQDLYISGSFSNSTANPSGGTWVDASHTSTLELSSLTPGAGFISASGATYSVPEPGSALAVVCGTSVLLAGARRRRGIR
jgi:hypothetical protein